MFKAGFAATAPPLPRAFLFREFCRSTLFDLGAGDRPSPKGVSLNGVPFLGTFPTRSLEDDCFQ